MRIAILKLRETDSQVAWRLTADVAQRLADWLGQLMLSYKDRIVPITTPVARRWRKLSSELGLADADILIAATALEHGLTVVTRNERHFAPTEVRVLNPWV